MYDIYLFDLDGTLTKSDLGIFNCIKYSLDWKGIPYPSDDVLRSFIGPSLYDSYTKHFNMNKEEALSMVDKYRERYADVGLFENEVYEGVRELLAELKKRGASIHVATSKPTDLTLRILEKFELIDFFTSIEGARIDGTSSDKKAVIERCINNCKAAGTYEGKRIVMVGDRFYDIEGGKSNSIDTIGVLYGYGTKEELSKAGADYIVENALDILSIK